MDNTNRIYTDETTTQSIRQLSSEINHTEELEEITDPSARTFENYQEEIRKQNFRKTDTIRRQIPKMGRNDPCPCGSQKKLKKCGCRVAKMFL